MFKVGQLVRTKPDLIPDRSYNGLHYSPSMESAKAKVIEIRDHYLRTDIGWWYAPEMLVPLNTLSTRRKRIINVNI